MIIARRSENSSFYSRKQEPEEGMKVVDTMMTIRKMPGFQLACSELEIQGNVCGKQGSGQMDLLRVLVQYE
jgi:hypothetical protein